jgi:hypothetical protein
MPKSGHTEEQIVAVLRQVEAEARGRRLPQGGDQPSDLLSLEAEVYRGGSERVVLSRSVEDANGYLCGLPSTAQCCDCGSMLCDLHTEECEICQEIYCSMCCLFHMDQPHSKPNVPVKPDEGDRRIA